MAWNKSDKTRILIIIGILLLSVIIALALRSVASGVMVSNGTVRLFESDPWYNLRQIEVMVSHFPQYDWFDPMTAFPTGKEIDWGPVFPFLAGLVCLVAGAATRPEIMYVASWVPPLFGMIMVPVVFLLGRTLCNWKVGLIGSLMMAVVGGEYFYRSSFGYIDHHISEVLFSTIFCLLYISALITAARKPVRLSDPDSMKIPILLSVAAGAAFCLGLFTMNTVTIFGFIVGIFTIIQIFVDYYRNRESDYLLLINLCTFGVVLVAYLLFGVRQAGISLSQYSIAHVYSYAILIAATVVLWILSRTLRKDPRYFAASVVGAAVIALGAVTIAAPAVSQMMVTAFTTFFGRPEELNPIVELKPWTLLRAWTSFNIGLFFAGAGILVLVYHLIRKTKPATLFVLSWSLVILVSTALHHLYEYYFAVNVVLLTMVTAGFVMNRYSGELSSLAGGLGLKRSPVPEPEQKETREKEKKKGRAARKAEKGRHGGDPTRKVVLLGMLGLLAVFFFVSVYYNYSAVSSADAYVIPTRWVTALDWLGSATPDTGVDYYGLYEKSSFRYPDEAYGIMSWWDYGHWITYLSKRIPNTNPFQDHVIASATFFASTSENASMKIAKNQESRFVVSDTKMAITKFPAIATWYNSTSGVNSFIMTFTGSDGAVSSFIDRPFYQTTVVRLQLFDGSATEPGNVVYTEFRDSTTGSPPLLLKAESTSPADAQKRVDAFNKAAAPGEHAVILSNRANQPIEPVPALRHFRLIYESPKEILVQNYNYYDLVKVFEIVPGAKIRGEGTIELGLVTNEGRNFTYRQNSENGTFTVPYSTVGTPYEVRPAGKYHITGTERYFDVTESDVLEGKTIN